MSDALQAEAVALLARCDGRAASKRLAAEVEGPARAGLRAAIVQEGRRRGAELPDEAVDWPGKRLLRRALALDGEAQRIRSPIARDEAFVCAKCSREISPHGRTARDHCPHCLYSRHVDVIPGDRAAECGGLLRPMGVERRGERWVIHYKCEACAALRVNQAVLDGDPGDDWALVMSLAARGWPLATR